MDLLAQMRWPQWSLALVLIAVCFLLMIVILLQRGRGGGLAGAFGGGGGSSAFGAKTGDVFTWITVIMAGAFVGLAVTANFVFDQSPKPDPPPTVISFPVSPEPEGTGESIPITVTPVEAPPTQVQDDATSGTGLGEDTSTPGTERPQRDDSPTNKGDAPDRGDEENPSP